jgi:malate dehydrogenase (oxaloacetate-decarboxylating)(NADP+)
LAARSDIIMASGRSDFLNQVNNVLGFPSLFRGALDCHATAITQGMQLAATRALAALAKENVPDYVCRAYDVDHLTFGTEYIIPKPFDMRVPLWVAPAVAQAAMEGGVAQEHLDIARYRDQLQKRLG